MKNYLIARKINTMIWPAQSLDFNPLENLLQIAKINITKRGLKNKLQLEQFTIEAWNKIDKKACKRLVQSMNNQ